MLTGTDFHHGGFRPTRPPHPSVDDPPHSAFKDACLHPRRYPMGYSKLDRRQRLRLVFFSGATDWPQVTDKPPNKLLIGRIQECGEGAGMTSEGTSIAELLARDVSHDRIYISTQKPYLFEWNISQCGFFFVPFICFYPSMRNWRQAFILIKVSEGCPLSSICQMSYEFRGDFVHQQHPNDKYMI